MISTKQKAKMISAAMSASGRIAAKTRRMFTMIGAQVLRSATQH
jgi:hypothetical protein